MTTGRGSIKSGAELWRTFCAIELSAHVQSHIASHLERLRANAAPSDVSWSRVENIHLTIKFFGDVEAKNISPIASAASRAVSTFQPFPISIAGAGAFPKTSQPRVLWIGVKDDTGQLSELHARFEKEAAGEGFIEEARGFHPHLTIARIRKPAGAQLLAETNQQLGFEPVETTVNELVVFRSELSSKGSKYIALSRHHLSDSLSDKL